MELRTVAPVAEDALFDVAAIGGAAGGDVGGHEVTTTVTVDAATAVRAVEGAVATVQAVLDGHVGVSEVVALEVLTAEEADRRLAR